MSCPQFLFSVFFAEVPGYLSSPVSVGTGPQQFGSSRKDILERGVKLGLLYEWNRVRETI